MWQIWQEVNAPTVQNFTQIDSKEVLQAKKEKQRKSHTQKNQTHQ